MACGGKGEPRDDFLSVCMKHLEKAEDVITELERWGHGVENGFRSRQFGI